MIASVLRLLVEQAFDVELLELLEALGHLVEFARHRLELGQRLRPEPHVDAALAEAAQPLGQFRERPRQSPCKRPRQRDAGQQQDQRGRRRIRR